jgi:hypothetical protein
MKSVLSLLMAVVLFLLLPSCVAGPQPFTISSVSDKFSDPTAPSGIAGLNNRLSKKSSRGGIHVDNRGVYLNPYALKDKKTGEIMEVGFTVSHFSFEPDDGFRPIEEIVFLTDRNERIAFRVSMRDSDFKVGSWNTVSKKYNTSYSENGTGILSPEAFSLLAAAQSVEVKIQGGKRSQTYGKKDVLPEFLENLRQFRAAMLK